MKIKERLQTKKYHYDPNTLDYKEIKTSSKERFFKGGVFLLSSFSIALLIYFVTFDYFESPKEKILRRELDNMKYKYEEIFYRVSQSTKVLESIKNRDNNIYRIYFGVDPIPNDIRKGGFGGVDIYKSLQGYDNSDLITEVSQKLDILDKQLFIQTKSLDEIVEIAKEKDELMICLPAIQPIQNSDLKRLASGYGIRFHHILKARMMHYGMDFSAKIGTPIYATGNGVIKKVSSKGAFGKHVVIDHGFGYETLYAHMSKFNTKKGKKIKRGEIIGYVGNTGRSAGPHVHYEVRKNGRRLDPVNFYSVDLGPEEFQKIKELASKETYSYD